MTVIENCVEFWHGFTHEKREMLVIDTN